MQLFTCSCTNCTVLTILLLAASAFTMYYVYTQGPQDDKGAALYFRTSGCFRDDQTKTFMESSVYFLKHFDKGREGPCLGVKHLYLGIKECYVYIHFKALSISMYHLQGGFFNWSALKND